MTLKRPLSPNGIPVLNVIAEIAVSLAVLLVLHKAIMNTPYFWPPAPLITGWAQEGWTIVLLSGIALFSLLVSASYASRDGRAPESVIRSTYVSTMTFFGSTASMLFQTASLYFG